MFELRFSFDKDIDNCCERLKAVFINCRQLSFEESCDIIKIALDSSSDNWGNIWSGVWALTEQEWFVKSIGYWQLAVTEQNIFFEENLLSYCREKEKGLFRKNPE